MRFCLLGPLEVGDEGRQHELPGRKPRALLALLLVHAPRVVPVDRIVDGLWGEVVPETAAKMVQIYVSGLRRALGPALIVTRAPGYAIDLRGHELDLADLAALQTRGREELQHDAAAAARTLADALALWRGPALAEFEEPFAQVEAARLEETRLGCLEERIAADLACGRHREVIGELEALVKAEPLRPRPVGQLMLALYRAGRHVEALDAYRRHREELDELGIDAPPQLRQLERRILQQDASLDLEPSAPAAAGAGAPRAQRAASRLLERDAPLAALVDAYRSAAHGAGRAVLVTGEPGIGKTTLVGRFVDELPARARVLVGACDDLSIPRPLGPFLDLADRASPAFAEAIAGGRPLHELQTLLLGELALAPAPTVLVIEDAHWADGASLDAIALVGRRIGSLPALLVVTYRAGEVSPAHPLRAALAAIRADDSTVVELCPLSEEAVAVLAGERAHDVYVATGGNPFLVTELLAAGGDASATDAPPSVATAVLGRASRLSDAERRLIELVSLVPGRMRTALLDVAVPDWHAAAEEPERRHLLEIDDGHVHFRHELARHAVRASVPVAARRRLHAQLVQALLATGAEPAEIVHHAEAAGATDVVADHVLPAARRAAALGSNREAYSHYARAADFHARLAPGERALALEELAVAAYLADRLPEALDVIQRAIACCGQLGDVAAVGRCTRRLSRFHWYAGDGDRARAEAREAMEVLEPLGESVELARAYAGFCQLLLLNEEVEDAASWAERALQLATRLGDEPTRAAALVNLGITRIQVDPDDDGPLLEAHAFADRVGERYEATRALGSAMFTLMHWARPAPARVYARRALDYARAHEVHNLAAYAEMADAWLRLRAGAWRDAERAAIGEIERGTNVSQLLAKRVLTELAVRRGDADADARLADLVAQADRTRELQRIAPGVELEAERALLTGAPLPVERLETLLASLRHGGRLRGSGAARIAAWAVLAGLDVDVAPPLPTAHAELLRRDWRAAAAAYAAIGWSYDSALLLSLLDDEAALAEAGRIARGLGAAPLARRVEARLGGPAGAGARGRDAR
jgi:DNA-binding SARP family transcriptional activator